MSNEATYREAWATFVDDAIKRQSVNGDGERFGDRVGLRDLIQLEEVLSKLAGKENLVSFPKGSGGGTQDLPRVRYFLKRKIRTRLDLLLSIPQSEGKICQNV